MGTLTRNTGDRKSLLDDGRWLSLDRRGNISRDLNDNSNKPTTPEPTSNGFTSKAEIEIHQPNTALNKSKDESQVKIDSQEKEDYGDLTKARSFWKTLDDETVRRQSGDFGSRFEGQEYQGRRESNDYGSRPQSTDFGSRRQSRDFGSNRQNRDLGSRHQSMELNIKHKNGNDARRDNGDVIRESKRKIESRVKAKTNISPEPEPDYETDKERP